MRSKYLYYVLLQFGRIIYFREILCIYIMYIEIDSSSTGVTARTYLFSYTYS